MSHPGGGPNSPYPVAGGPGATGGGIGAGRTTGTTTGMRTGAGSSAEPPRARPKPGQPLRARWDPTDDSGRIRVDRDAQPERKKQSALGRFVATYGWRAYAIPVLIVLTVVLIVVTVRSADDTAFVPAADAGRVLAAMRAHPLGTHAVVIGACVADHPGMVVAKTALGGTRVVDLPIGEQLPRIC